MIKEQMVDDKTLTTMIVGYWADRGHAVKARIELIRPDPNHPGLHEIRSDMFNGWPRSMFTPLSTNGEKR